MENRTWSIKQKIPVINKILFLEIGTTKIGSMFKFRFIFLMPTYLIFSILIEIFHISLWVELLFKEKEVK